jgi:phosphoglycerate kinase
LAAYRTLDDAGDVTGKRVLVRADLNVPMRDGPDGKKVSDDTRIRALAPTIAELVAKDAKVILLSHFGRPKGKSVAEMSLAPIAPAVEKVIGRPVAFARDCIGKAAADAIATLQNGAVLLLENTRFHAGEENNDADFAAALAALGDLYVNDAFSAAHRAHASTLGLARLLPAFAGRAMQGELNALDKVLANPEKPLLAIIGGAKVSTKIDLLANLVQRVDALVIGGAMANTFLAAKGAQIGKSLHEADLAGAARQIMIQAAAARTAIVLPSDAVIATALEPGAASETVTLDKVPADAMILDVGEETVKIINAWIDNAATLVWNGPLGAFEVPPFDRGTIAAARHAAARTMAGRLLSVAGGGDTVAALNHAGIADDFSYVSTAGGAFLEWLEGKTLPGVDALRTH